MRPYRTGGKNRGQAVANYFGVPSLGIFLAIVLTVLSWEVIADQLQIPGIVRWMVTAVPWGVLGIMVGRRHRKS